MKANEMLILIPGTKCAIQRYTWGWAVYEMETHTRRAKDGQPEEQYEEWGDAVYPIDFAHAAKIIAERCGNGAGELREMLAQIVAEREKLTFVLEKLIRRAVEENIDPENVELRVNYESGMLPM